MGGGAHASFTVAALCGVGGAAGFAMKRSRASLYAGGATAALMAGSGLLIQQGRDFEGHAAGALTSTLLAGAMGYRAVAHSSKVGAAVGLVGALSAAYHSKKTADWR
ncbi:hypothetical protein M885DRAFT_114002 [Pelagophyceae sp. CCMP2097]|nr:hypothetical protein M885DRAFT_114002 [Pelagophyceae sp. CCMP2097]